MSQAALLLLLGGNIAAVSTPTSSQLLGRVSPPRLAPLVFSIKQTAVPSGLLICGFLGPAMAAALGWRGAVLVIAAACVLFAAALQPLRARFDDDRVPSRRFRLNDFRSTISSVAKAPDLRSLSLACFAFNGVQSVFTAYFVTYLVTLGYELAAAVFCFLSLSPLQFRAAFCGAGLAAFTCTLSCDGRPRSKYGGKRCTDRTVHSGVACWALCTIPAVWVGISLLRRRASIAHDKALSAKPVG